VKLNYTYCFVSYRRR